MEKSSMKVKKYLHPEKEGEEIGPHKSLKMQRTRGMPRCAFVKIVSMMFVENTTDTNTIVGEISIFDKLVQWELTD